MGRNTYYKITDENNNIKTEKEEVLRVWTRYFAKKFQKNKEDGYEEETVNRGQNMYNNEEGQEYFMEVEKEGQISYDEVKEAVNRIRTEKVPRGDGIYPELVR